MLCCTLLCCALLYCTVEGEEDGLGRKRRRRMMDWGGEAREGNEDREGRWRGGGRGEDFFNGIW